MRQRLWDRQLRRVGLAVQRPAASGVHDPVGVARPRALEHVERAEHVDVGVEHRPLHRNGHRGLGGQVEHDLGPAAGDQLDHFGEPDVQLVDPQGLASGRAGLGQVRQRTRREVIDDIDLVSFDEESIHQVGPDEPGASRD